jgi:predicted permease
MLDTIWRDLAHAVRSLGRTPGFTATAAATLALGIGANTALFSVADATALRPPDVPRPGEVVRVFTASTDSPYGEVSYADYLDYRDHATTLSGLVAYETGDFAFARSPRESATYLGGWLVSANFFSVLAVEPEIGRGFRPEDESAAAHVAVISHRLWETEFQKDSGVLGREVLISGARFTIVGVAPKRFGGTELYFHPDLFIPLPAVRSVYPSLPRDVLNDRAERVLTVLGRLTPGMTSAQAASELAAMAQNLERAHPATNRGRTAVVLPEVTARARLDAGGARGALVIMGLVGLVLLLACANVANLMLSKSAQRTRDLALRAAMGATRAHLVRQFLTESLLLAAASGALAVLVAGWVLAYLSRVIVIPSALPLWVDFRLDVRVLSFTALASLAAAVLFGLPPALQASRAGLNTVLKQRPDPVTGRLTLRSSLVVLQVGLSVLVLVSAGLMVQATAAAQRVDPGFRTDRVLLASFNPGLAQIDLAGSRRFYERLVERTRALPGVAAVGLTRYVPLGVSSGSIALGVDGARMPDGGGHVLVAETVVDPGYWDVLRTPIVRGRAFDASDTDASPRVAIVNETMARQYWPDQDPIGRTIRMADSPDPNGPLTLTLEVIGVARDGKYWQLGEPPRPFIYRPFSQVPGSRMTMVVLASGEALGVASSVLAAAAGVDPDVPVFDVRTLEDLYWTRALLPSRVMSSIVTALGALALLLASVGLYAVIAFIFSRRTREIGVRMAVGSTPHAVLRMVLGQAAALVVPGLALGVGLALLLTPLLAAPAFDFVTPGDPLALTLAPLAMAIVALIAAAFPAVRAARVNPIGALRSE